MRTSVLSLLLFIFANFTVFAQIEKGKSLFFKQNYQKALPILERVIELESENAEAYYYAGICHLETYNSSTGLEYIQKAVDLDSGVGGTHQNYWLGIAHHFNYKFSEAEGYFKAYKETLSKEDVMLKTVDKWLKEIELAQKPIEFTDRYWVESLPKGVNTDHSEHSPVISKDGKTLIFTSRAEGSTGGLAALDGFYYEDIYMVKLADDGTWSKPEPISDMLNTDHHDASCQLFDNDSKMLLYRWERDGDLFMTTKISADTWSEPERLSKKINSKDFESHGFVTADGKAIYFTSNRGNISGDLDIYVSFKNKEGEWQKAIKLGVNSPFDDDAPFVTPDGQTLFFSSRGHDSMGGFDIFRSDWDEKRKTWGKPQNLGNPINTPEDDSYLVLEGSGQFGYFSSNRRSGLGRKDLYRFGKVFNIEMKGTILNSENSLPIGNIKAIFKPKEYDTQFEATVNEEGNFNVNLPSDWEYDVVFQLEDGTKLGEETALLPIAKVDKSDFQKSFEISYKEDPRLPRLRVLKGQVKNLFTLAPVSGTLDIRNAITGLPITSIDATDGYFEGEIEVPANQTLIIDFYQDTLIFSRIDEFETTAELEIERNFKIGKGQVLGMEGIDDEDPFGVDGTIEGTDSKKIIKGTDGPKEIGGDKPKGDKKLFHSERTIYFSYGQSQLKKPIKRQLDKIVIMMANDNELVLNLEGHTDNVSSSTFNLKLSQKRVSEVKNYLMSQGVPENKINTAYFGETKPILPNEINGQDAPQNREKNRRVEISLDK